MAEETPERKNIDAIDFAILSFLSTGSHGSKELRDLLEQYTQLELSRSPFFRRMRELIKEGYVTEESKGAGSPSVYSITGTGKTFCLDWANTLVLLANLAKYILEEEEGDWQHERK